MVYEFVRGRAEQVLADTSRDSVGHAIALAADAIGLSEMRRVPPHPADSIVYYLRVGDLIKIGRTVSLSSRMNGYPPGVEVLATEPGGHDVEAMRLDMFDDLLSCRREWFTPGSALIEHINGLRAAIGQDLI